MTTHKALVYQEFGQYVWDCFCREMSAVRFPDALTAFHDCKQHAYDVTMVARIVKVPTQIKTYLETGYWSGDDEL